MGLVAVYRIEHDRLPLVAVAETVPTVTLDLEVGQPNLAGPPTFVVRATGGEFEALEAAFGDSSFVEDYSRVSTEAERRQYRILPSIDHWEEFRDSFEEPAKLQAMAANESVVEQIEVVPSGWVQKRWFADRDSFEAYCEFWRTEAGFALERLSEDDRQPSRRVVTDAQQEALWTAHEMGYFEVPRRNSLEAIADELGVSQPALSERLRRANANLVEDFLARDLIKPRRE
jgi:hypothetical protein